MDTVIQKCEAKVRLKQTSSVIERLPGMEHCATGILRPNSGRIGHKLRPSFRRESAIAANRSVKQMTDRQATNGTILTVGSCQAQCFRLERDDKPSKRGQS